MAIVNFNVNQKCLAVGKVDTGGFELSTNSSSIAFDTVWLLALLRFA